MKKIITFCLLIFVSFSLSAFSFDDDTKEKKGYKKISNTRKLDSFEFIEVFSMENTLAIQPSFEFAWMNVDLYSLEGRLIESVKITDASEIIDLDTDEERLYISIVTNHGYEFAGEITL